MCEKNIFVADLLGSQYLFEILQTSVTVEIVKMGQNLDVLKNVCNEERQFFFEMKEGYKVSCVKILIFRSLIRRLVFI